MRSRRISLFEIGDLFVEPISTSHDAADPVAYKIKNEEKTAAVVTDLGTYDENMNCKIKNLDVLFTGSKS